MPPAQSILLLNTYNRLGKKTYWIFLSRHISVAMLFLALAFLASLSRFISLPQQIHVFASLASVICFVIFIISLIVAVITSSLTYKSYGFCLTEDAFKLKHGIFTEREIAIPYRQIQNVSIERTFSEQLMGLSRIIISTASPDDAGTMEDESRGILPVIDKNMALALQEELLKRTDVQRVTEVK